jgi:hypothetical protein
MRDKKVLKTISSPDYQFPLLFVKEGKDSFSWQGWFIKISKTILN